MAGLKSAPGRQGTLAFSTDALPARMSRRHRFDAAVGALDEIFGGSCDIVPAEDRPFRLSFKGVALGDAKLIFPAANIGQWRFAGCESGVFHIGINRHASPILVRQRGRECTLAQGDAALTTLRAPIEVQSSSGTIAVSLLNIPAPQWRRRIADPEGLIAVAAPRSPALRHFRRNVAMVARSGELSEDAACAAHAAAGLFDLAALTFGRNDTAALADAYGIRRARLQTILAAIETDYASPAFSGAALARRLGLSQRYIQELLQQSGRGLSERVQELRLQKARATLAAPQSCGMKIIDIALASGFGDVSHFNRVFRRRFGMAPRQARADIKGRVAGDQQGQLPALR